METYIVSEDLIDMARTDVNFFPSVAGYITLSRLMSEFKTHTWTMQLVDVLYWEYLRRYNYWINGNISNS